MVECPETSLLTQPMRLHFWILQARTRQRQCSRTPRSMCNQDTPTSHDVAHSRGCKHRAPPPSTEAPHGSRITTTVASFTHQTRSRTPVTFKTKTAVHVKAPSTKFTAQRSKPGAIDRTAGPNAGRSARSITARPSAEQWVDRSGKRVVNRNRAS